MVTTRGYRLQDPTPSILLVDGNPDHAELTRVALRRASRSNRVIHCHDGDEALRFIDDIDREPMAFDLPALILLDLSMPRMSGGDFLGQLLSMGSKTKVIVISGYAPKEAESMGVKGYLKKPFRARELLQTVRKVLDEESE